MRHILKLLESISETRLSQLVTALQSFETRHTLSSTASPTRGIGAARQWILHEMRRTAPGLSVSFDSHHVEPTGRVTRAVELCNVVGILQGRSSRRVYVSGHYDSVAREAGRSAEASGHQMPGPAPDFDRPAPGANDDGSGTALVMELARVFAESGLDFDATLVFMAAAGEEQELVGSRLHARQAAAERLRIDAVLNNDLVGNPVGGNGVADAERVRVFSEGPEDSPSRQLARFVRRQAARYIPSHRVRLVARRDRFGRCGDHTSFNEEGFPAVRITESREDYSRQHTPDDNVQGVSFAYLARNARVNAAALATLALAPPAPVVTDALNRPMLTRAPSGYDANLRWESARGAIGYRVFWRDTWANDWESELSVGNETAHVLRDVSIDDHVFGVAAVGPGGDESVVSVYLLPSAGSGLVDGLQKTSTGSS